MVICIITMIVFSILGIFSAKYRKLAKESFECTGKMLTFRPCTSNLDQRVKTALTAKLMTVNKPTAKFVYKYFSALSVIFVFAFFISMFYSAYAIANYFVYGNCDPGQPASHCIIGQAGAALKGIWPLLTCGTAYALYAAVIVVVIAVVVIRYLDKRSKK